jgi:hypothetical protein
MRANKSDDHCRKNSPNSIGKPHANKMQVPTIRKVDLDQDMDLSFTRANDVMPAGQHRHQQFTRHLVSRRAQRSAGSRRYWQ